MWKQNREGEWQYRRGSHKLQDVTQVFDMFAYEGCCSPYKKSSRAVHQVSWVSHHKIVVSAAFARLPTYPI